MNPTHLQFICTELQLGSPKGSVTSVYGSRGGSFVWRVRTDKASYAIKQLAPVIDLQSEKILSKYELSEIIAHRFTQLGIQAVSAYEKSGKHLFIFDNTGYLVYPWIEAYMLGRDEVSETHALKIAETIAKLHSINLQVPEVELPHVDRYTRDHIVAAIDRAISLKCPFAISLKENQTLILSLNENYLSIIPILLQDTVITHGDINQPNVLWDKAHQPILIDWESARKLNPTREIIRACINWSGIGTANSSLAIYTQMLRTYIKSGGMFNQDHIQAAFYSSIGSMVYWMLYNIDIASASVDARARAAAIDEVDGVMVAMMQFDVLVPELLNVSIE